MAARVGEGRYNPTHILAQWLQSLAPRSKKSGRCHCAIVLLPGAKQSKKMNADLGGRQAVKSQRIPTWDLYSLHYLASPSHTVSDKGKNSWSSQGQRGLVFRKSLV